MREKVMIEAGRVITTVTYCHRYTSLLDVTTYRLPCTAPEDRFVHLHMTIVSNMYTHACHMYITCMSHVHHMHVVNVLNCCIEDNNTSVYLINYAYMYHMTYHMTS